MLLFKGGRSLARGALGYMWPPGERLRSEGASSLSVVLLLLLIISTLTGLILMMHQGRAYLVQQRVDRLSAYYAAEAGLHRALARLHHRPEWRPDGERVDCLPAPSGNTVRHASARSMPHGACQIVAQPFGGYLRLEATARVGKARQHLAALVGRRPAGLFENAVVLEDTKADFVLAGRGSIRGEVLMGRGEMKTEPFGRFPFTGERPGGVASRSGLSLPPFDASLPRETVRTLQPYLAGKPRGARTMEEARRQRGGVKQIRLPGGERKDRERDRQRALVSDGNLTLTAADSAVVQQVRVIAARGTLSVRGPLRFGPWTRLAAGRVLQIRDAHLPYGIAYGTEDVVLEGYTRGQALQVLAGRRAVVRGATYLQYPSLIFVRGLRDAGSADVSPGQQGDTTGRLPEGGPARQKRGGIAIGGQALVEGTLLYQPEGPTGTPGRGRRRITVAAGAKVRGAVYATGRTELRGRVEGTVLTREFYHYRSPTRYINWLAEGEVDVGARPAGFHVPFGLGEEPPAMVRLAPGIAGPITAKSVP